MSTPEVQWTVSASGHVDLVLIGDGATVVEETRDRVHLSLTREAWALLRDTVAPPVAAPASRGDALKWARDHVEAMSANVRGYQDGVKLADKVTAVEAFARFLMGEGE